MGGADILCLPAVASSSYLLNAMLCGREALMAQGKVLRRERVFHTPVPCPLER